MSETATLAAPGLSIRRVPVSDLHHDPANTRDHNDRNVATIVSSLKTFGQVEPLVVQKGTNKVIGGNGRLTAMLKMGVTEVDVVELDVDNITAAGLGIALNRTAELADWNYDALHSVLTTLKAENFAIDAIGFTTDEVEGMFKQAAADVAEVTKGFTLKDAAESHPQLATFLEARRKGKERYADKAQTNYWLCLVFQSFDQKREFLKDAKVADVPTIYGMYVDGQALADKVGVAVTPNALPVVNSPMDKRLTGMVMR